MFRLLFTSRASRAHALKIGLLVVAPLVGCSAPDPDAARRPVADDPGSSPPAPTASTGTPTMPDQAQNTVFPGLRQTSGPGYTVTIDKNESRGTWEGWGCSLAWWGNGVGNSDYESLYADLLFTRGTVSVLGQALPGLGMNIVRYNVGGGGQKGDIADTPENVPASFPWYKDIDGYWIDWQSTDPSSSSYDFWRDSNQRNVLWRARDRGVDVVELFSNAPMWWMTDAKSSAGGRLQQWNRRDFARYIATVAKYARDNWGVDVSSVEPFNEPSAGWWNYPKEQEGVNLSLEEQREILGALREELDARGLGSLSIAASDENSMTQATSTWTRMQGERTQVGGADVRVSDLVDKVNVHAYRGIEPWRDNSARQALRAAVGGKRLWMSEYGDGDGSGMPLAQTITEDLTYLRPTAWIYWQPIEPYSAWGLVNADYDDSPTQPNRAEPTWVYYKYYVMAQFTRFIRPGNTLLGNNDHNTVVAYDASQRTLAFVTVNYGNAQRITYDLSSLSHVGSRAAVTTTNTAGSKLFERSTARVVGRRLDIAAEANSIDSIVVSDVDL